MKSIKLLLLAGIIMLFTGCGALDSLVEGVDGDTDSVHFTHVEISPDNIIGTINSTIQLTATLHFTDGHTEDVTKQVSWSTRDNNIASIDSQGLVELLSGGNTGVEVKFTDPENESYWATTGITIHVLAGNFTSIELALPDMTLPNSITANYRIYGIETDGTKVDITNVNEYTNDLEVLVENDTVLEFNRGQLVTKNVGTSNVTIKYGDVESSYTFTVVNGTEISGQHSTDLVLTQDNSPYILTDNIQIGYDATLTIEPGVRLYNKDQYAITVFGYLDALGTDADKIELNSIFFSPGNNQQNDRSVINIDKAVVRGGEVYGMMGTGSGQGSLHLTNSILYNTGSTYLFYPNADCYIEKNIFVDSGYIDVSVGYVYEVAHDVTVYIENNVFDQPQAVVSSGILDSSAIIVQYNTFLDTNGTAVTLQYEEGAITTASHNYWSTTDTSVINSMIYDNNDDFTVKNSIEFEPFLTEPDSNTPAYKKEI
jgi:hypothetical protein